MNNRFNINESEKSHIRGLLGIDAINEQETDEELVELETDVVIDDDEYKGYDYYIEEERISQSEYDLLKKTALKTMNEEIMGKTLNLYMGDEQRDYYNNRLASMRIPFEAVGSEGGFVGRAKIKGIELAQATNTRSTLGGVPHDDLIPGLRFIADGEMAITFEYISEGTTDNPDDDIEAYMKWTLDIRELHTECVQNYPKRDSMQGPKQLLVGTSKDNPTKMLSTGDMRITQFYGPDGLDEFFNEFKEDFEGDTELPRPSVFNAHFMADLLCWCTDECGGADFVTITDFLLIDYAVKFGDINIVPDADYLGSIETSDEELV